MTRRWTLRSLAANLRSWNEAFDGPAPVCLAQLERASDPWKVQIWEEDRTFYYASVGFEELPGDGLKFDATAAARRLLADLGGRA